MKYLMIMTALGDFDPTRLFGVFIGRVNLENNNMVIHEFGELATISAVCFLWTFRLLMVTDPASGVLTDLRQRYDKVFPLGP